MHTVESIVLSIILMPSRPNDESPANIEATVEIHPIWQQGKLINSCKGKDIVVTLSTGSKWCFMGNKREIKKKKKKKESHGM